MTYQLKRHDDFLDDWNDLSRDVQIQLKKKLEKVQQNPHIPKNRLKGELSSCYKIKLRKAGIRLVYQVIDDEVVILLVTVGKRADSEVYEEAKHRLT